MIQCRPELHVCVRPAEDSQERELHYSIIDDRRSNVERVRFTGKQEEL
jgi:hypothetical protein